MVKTEKLQKYEHIGNQYKDAIIVHPIMTGGLVPKEVQKKLSEEGWTEIGYSACFDCLEGRSGLISKPPIIDFLADIADFFGGDRAEHTFGCRAAQFAVMKTIRDFIEGEGSKDYGKTALVDPLCHYTTVIAAEAAGLSIVESTHSGYAEYKVEAQRFRDKIESIKKETGRLPGLVVVTHAEPYYGNLNPVEEIGKITQEYGIPYMVNVAYTGGIMPLNMRDFNADFLTVSAHKSMASLGPLGFLVTNYDWTKRAFKTSKTVAEWSGRTFGKKVPNIFGCSIGGIPLISAMYSFPHVARRVEKWTEELDKTRRFVQEIEKLDDIMLIGEHPHRHHLLHFETPILWEISKHHKRKGFFLAEDMVKRGIVGFHRGLSKHVKLSLYGLERDEVERVKNAFFEIAEDYAKEFKIDYCSAEETTREGRDDRD